MDDFDGGRGSDSGDEFDPTREAAVVRDREDPLAHLGDRFSLSDEYYMDGNSLGPLSTDAERTLSRVVDEWREQGIRGWTDANPDWFNYGEHLGDRLAPLLGADGDEVVVTNSTTVNIHTLVGTFLDELAEDDAGRTVLVNDLDFPTDHYAIRAQLRQRGLDPDDHLRLVESRDGRTIEEDDVVAAVESEDVGIVFMPSVLYRSGQLLDVERITRAAHDNGAYAGFDLAHSVGVVPHALSANDVDFAVWCSYKYLNAGPGAVGGLYVNETHFESTPALAGWWGHEKSTQFDMNLTHTPAGNAGGWQIGTVHVLSAAPLEGSLDVFEETTIDAVRGKSVALTDYLLELVDARLPEFDVGTPSDSTRRGGHVALEHPEAYRISLALKEHGVVVDFRRPNVLRVCPAPLYVGYADVWDVVGILREIVEEEAYATFDPRGDGVT